MRKSLVAVFLALACSSSSTPSGGSVALEQVPGELSKVYCEKIYACCSATERMNNFLVGTDQMSCQVALGAFLSFVVPELQASISKGRAAYHPEKMGTCVSQLRATSCADLKANAMGVSLTSIPECAAAFEAKVAIGGACDQNGECTGGFCDDDMKKCAALKADGQACASGEECTNGSCNNDKCGAPTPGTAGICN
jgi:hypothetical protein